MSKTETSSCLFEAACLFIQFSLTNKWFSCSLAKAVTLVEDPVEVKTLETRQASGDGSAHTQGKAWTGKAQVLRKCSARQWHSICTRTLKSTGKPGILGRTYIAPEYLLNTPVVPDMKNAFVGLFKILTVEQLEDMKLQSYILFLLKPKQFWIQSGQLM